MKKSLAAIAIVTLVAAPTISQSWAATFHGEPAFSYEWPRLNDNVTTHRSGSFYRGAEGSGYRKPTNSSPSYGRSQPYADRPYGDPDSW